MKSQDGLTSALWKRGNSFPKQAGIRSNHAMKVDVCIVGAGIAGLTTAYFAAKRGLTVAVFDEHQLGDGQTARTSAHLASAIDDRFFEIERLHGTDHTRLAYESHAKAIDVMEEIARVEGIECDFVRLNGFLSRSASDPANILDREYAAAKRAGFKDVELVGHGGMYKGQALRFGDQARFHPLKYLFGLANAVKAHGGKIFCGRRVIDVQGVEPKTRAPGRVKLRGIRRTVEARHIVVATNTPAPINDWFGIYTKQASYRSYVIATSIPKNTVPDALYWDTADPYHYVRLERGADADLLIVGGEDHKTGQMGDFYSPFLRLEEWARKTFPGIHHTKFRWSGQVQEPADGLAFIGRALTATEEVYVATGDSGMGLTHGTIAGLLICDQITGTPNPWEAIYDPGRKILNSEFVKENANTLAQYRDLVTSGEVKSADEVPRGHGAVLRHGLTKVALYRDDNGALHSCSAICTHLQCVVRWNHIESTWDCPCHGSRFDRFGKVLMGPAIDDLPPVK